MTAVAPHAAERLPARRELRLGPLALSVPAAVGMLVFFAAPLVTFVVYSFLTTGLFSVSGPLTLASYRTAVSSGVTGTFALNSFEVGILAAAVTVAVSLPIAYWLRYAAGRWRMFVLFAITATVFASYLVRVYAWRSILGAHGLLNDGLQRIGVIDHPVGFLLYSRFAITVALVHIFLPYVVLVLYAGFTPLSPAYLESAQDLGANAFVRWRRVILPLVAAPAASAFLFVFVLCASDYVTPQFLGATRDQLLGVQIQANFKGVGNWPLGAAQSLLMLASFVVCYGLIAIGLRLARLDRIRWGT
jgi:spermidine/putrescine transport system permease protein